VPEDFEVNPWDVKGKVDYDKLIERFGTQRITSSLKSRMQSIVGELHPMLRRDVFFSHRDLDLILNDYIEGRGFFLYTGRGPSKEMHIGHLIPFVFTKWLQDKFKVNLYIEVTDDEKFMQKTELDLEETRKWAYSNIQDIAAVGFDPERTFIFTDVEYIRNMYPLAVRIAKKLTFSEVRATFGFNESTNVGMLFYPSLQIVPTMFEKRRCLIPAGIDQDPYWRLQRDIAESLGYFKVAAIHSKFMPPLTGTEGKMSASQPETAIYLTDDPKTVRFKVNRYAFSGGQPTVELHRKLGGNPEIDVPFQWLYYFFEPDDNLMLKVERDYRSGSLLTGELKEMLIERINDFLERHRERREASKDMVNVYMREGKLAVKMWDTLHGLSV
jgi:tryptophanyl-tRNA synthetase